MSAEAGSPLDSPRFVWRGTAGEGAMGTVFRADDLSLGRSVAVKVLRPHLADDPTARAHFLREARGLMAIKHPHIVPALDSGADGRGRPFLVMALLTDVVPLNVAWKKLELAEFIELFAQALDAVGHLHARGWVHRDLKPENLLVGRHEGQPWVWLVDFGLAFADPTTVAGTPHYLAPERMKAGNRPAPAEDVYALGVILWEYLTGGRPYEGDHGVAVALQHATAPLPPLSPRTGISAPPDLLAAVRLALSKQPEQRFPNAQALGAALSRAMEVQAGPADDAAVRIADAVERVARRESSAPPPAVRPELWRAVQQHCTDSALARQVLSHLTDEGVLAWRGGWLELADPTAPRTETWPRNVAELAWARLGRSLANEAEPAALMAWATLLALFGADASDSVLRAAATVLGAETSPGNAPWYRLMELGIAHRHLGRVRLVEVGLGEALVRRSRNEAEGRRLAGVAATALAQAQPPVDPERVAALFLQAEAYDRAGEALARAARAALVRGVRGPALDLFEEAARQAGRAGGAEATRERGRLRLEGALAARSLGAVDRAVRAAQQVWAAASEVQDLPIMAESARLLAEVDRDLGRFAEARRGFLRVAELCQSAGDARGLAEARVAEGRLAWALGDPSAAAEAFDQAWGSAVRADAPAVEAEAAVALGEAALRLGQPTRALDGLARADEALATQPALAARGHWLAGEAHLSLGDPSMAGLSFEYAELQAARVPDDEAMARALGGRAKVAELAGDTAGAEALREAAVGRARAAGNLRLAARLGGLSRAPTPA